MIDVFKENAKCRVTEEEGAQKRNNADKAWIDVDIEHEAIDSERELTLVEMRDRGFGVLGLAALGR